MLTAFTVDAMVFDDVLTPVDRDRRLCRRLVLPFAVCALLAVLPTLAEGSAAVPRLSWAIHRVQHAADSSITIAASEPTLPAFVVIGRPERRIPGSFLGLSVEYTELSRFERAGTALDRAIALIGAGDSAPMLLRVGGASADRAWWLRPGEPRPPRGVFAFGRPWLAALAAMVARDRLRILLDLNLAVHSPVLAASFASAAAGTLRSALAGVEVGNEPDHYGRQPWLDRQIVAASEARISRHWTRGYTPLDYERDYRAYAYALKAAVRRVAIGGPEIASPSVRWLEPLVGLGRLAPAFVSAHRYASSSCWPKTSPRHPSIALLLSERVSAGLAASLRHMIAFASSHGIPLRVSELGSISCGGTPGVANAFATALWAPDVLFELLQAGVNGVNWHLRPYAPNAPFALTAAGIEPRPALYGLAIFAQVTGGLHAVLDQCTVNAPGLHIKAWAVGHRRQRTVLVINKGRRTAAVTVPAGTARSASLARLTAPSAAATRGVRYAGRWIGSDGRWHGRQRIVKIPVRGGVVRVIVPGASAVVITLSET